MKTTKTTSLILAGALAAAGSAQAATSIRVTFEATGSVGFAPGIAGFSDGSFDIFNPGERASMALETLAETGAPDGFSPPSGGPVFGPGIGPGSPPIFAPGASASATFSVADGDGMFVFASMILPSNDWFVGNGTAFDVSSLLGGNIGDNLSFDFGTIWDAGTELEDFASSPGNGLIGVTTMGSGDADVGTDQDGGVVGVVDTDNPFSLFDNASAGFNPSAFNIQGQNIGRVTLEVVPEPSTGLLAGLGLLLGLRHRRR